MRPCSIVGEREVFELQSMRSDPQLCRTVSDQSFHDLHIPFKKVREFSNVRFQVTLLCSMR